MTPLAPAESEANSKLTSTAYLGGALFTLGFSILTIGRASEWFDYVSGVIFLCLAGTLAYEGIAKRRRRAKEQSHP